MTIMMMLAAMVGAEQPAQAVDENVLKLAQENAAFAFELYVQLKTQEGNLLYSPYSISSALALAYGGARGETEHQMAKTLHFTLPQDSLHPAFSALGTYFKRLSDGQKLTLNIANSLWLDQSFSVLSAYQALTRTYYGAALAQVDYLKQAEKARTQINGWVAEQTQQKIAELLHAGDIDAQTAAVLVNAIYFKGTWRHPFDAALTNDAPFHVSKETQISVPTMQQTGTFEYGETDEWQLLALPYAREKVLMVIVLPQADDGLPTLEQQLSWEHVTTWMEQTSAQRVSVSLPKFSARFRVDVIETLAQLGLTLLADFSGMTEQSAQLTNVIHEAFIEVNEQGSEAAAATAVAMGRGIARPPVEFQADHPFVFFIVDTETGSVLFVGRVANPAA